MGTPTPNSPRRYRREISTKAGGVAAPRVPPCVSFGRPRAARVPALAGRTAPAVAAAVVIIFFDPRDHLADANWLTKEPPQQWPAAPDPIAPVPQATWR